MTNKEAIDCLKGTIWLGTKKQISRTRKAVDIAIDALEKSDKYRLHDLRKNPEDLPEDGKDVLITQKFIDSHACYGISSYAKDLYNVSELDFEDRKGIGGFFGYDSEYGYYEESNVVAWKYFKEDEQ